MITKDTEYLDPVTLVAWVRHMAAIEVITDDAADSLVGVVTPRCDWDNGVPVGVLRANPDPDVHDGYNYRTQRWA